MKRKSIHAMLTLLSDVEDAELYQDRLSAVISDTLRMAEEEAELMDDELDDIAAARKEVDYDRGDLPD